MPWKTVSMLWPAILAALLPLDLRTLVARLPRLLARLAALDDVGQQRATEDRARPRQVDNFRSRFAARLGKAA